MSLSPKPPGTGLRAVNAPSSPPPSTRLCEHVPVWSARIFVFVPTPGPRALFRAPWLARVVRRLLLVVRASLGVTSRESAHLCLAFIAGLNETSCATPPTAPGPDAPAADMPSVRPLMRAKSLSSEPRCTPPQMTQCAPRAGISGPQNESTHRRPGLFTTAGGFIWIRIFVRWEGPGFCRVISNALVRRPSRRGAAGRKGSGCGGMD